MVTETSPTTNFWTVYKKVADEHDNEMISKYVGDLDTSLLFVSTSPSLALLVILSRALFLCQAGLFSAVVTTFIVKIIPQPQPNPADLTNALLLRILERNTSFGGADSLAPISNIPTSLLRAQPILFASLFVTLFVAFIAVLGKQWIHYYNRVTTRGSIVDRGKEHQTKLLGLQKWGLHLIMKLLPAMLQLALLLFGAALIVYLWDLNVSAAEVVLVVASIGLIFYASIAVIATIWNDFPFQTPLSVVLPTLLPKVLQWRKEFAALVRVSLRHWWKRRTTSLLLRTQWMVEHSRLKGPLGRLFKTIADETNVSDGAPKGACNKQYPMTLSNPAFWRQDPLFTPPIPNDIAASAGFWLLENSIDHSVASAVAAVFSEIQWPSHLLSTTALIRLRDMYVECFRAPEFSNSTRFRALQSAAAYYVLYHTQLIWNTSKSPEVEIECLPPDLPPDLFHQHNGEWGGNDVFEHLLRAKDRSEPVTSARFLSYIAPYWFCGDSDATIRFRPSRLQTLNELIEVLEESHALIPASLTDCVLCVGVAMDLPLHPEDLIRIDKRWVLLSHAFAVELTGFSDYLQPTFKTVIEHVHGIVLARGLRRRYAGQALEILLTLSKKTTVPLVDATWINKLLESAARGNMDDDKFTLFMALSSRRKEGEVISDAETPGQEHVHVQGGIKQPPHGETVPSKTPTPEYILFTKIMQNIRNFVTKESGWQGEAVYGGLIAIRDIPRLGSFLPEGDTLRTLSKAMEKEENKPLRVREAAYNVILVARDGWLRSAELRPVLEDLDVPRKLHSVVTETGRSDHQRSFLEMIEILSEDRYWHSYLRKSMEIWLPLRHEGPDRVLRILTAVGELLLPGRDSFKPPLDKYLEKIVEDEWAGVPGRLMMNPTADRLKPLAEITEQLKGLLFTERDRKAVLGVVEQVIPSLERRRDDGYGDPGDGIRDIVTNILEILRMPTQPTNRYLRPAYR